MRKSSRTFQALIALIVMLFAGMIYSWSVLSSPIAAEFIKWSKVQLSFTFTLVMIMFCAGSIVGGMLSGKLRMRYYLLISGVLFLAGFYFSSRADSLLDLYLGFGVFCGLASGFTYNGVICTMACWYPDKPGFISGLLLMAFGFGSFFVGKLFQRFTPNAIGAWRGSFLCLGLVISAVFVACSFLLKAPDGDFKAPLPSRTKKLFKNPVSIEVTAREMITKTTFWLFYLWAIAISVAGLALISQASFIAKEVDSSVSPDMIATVVGLVSIFNGMGRILAGISFDKFGRRLTMRTINLGFIVTAAILTSALVTKNFPLLILGFILGGLSYGGVTPTNSAFTNSYFGSANYPVNFSITTSNLIIASFGSTIAGALFDATHSYLSICLLMAVMAVAGTILSALITLSYERYMAQNNIDLEAFDM